MNTEEITVYLVWTGEYSDKTVCGVFSTYERAEEFIKFLKKKDNWTEEELEKNFDYAYYEKEYRIQTVVLDAFSDEIEAGYSYFSGVMYFNRDSIIYEIPEEINSYKSGEEWEIKRKQKQLRFKIFAKDKEHAAKIANEKMSRLIAEGEYDKPDRFIVNSLSSDTVRL